MDIVSFLNERLPDGYKPQIILNKNKYMVWMPSTKKKDKMPTCYNPDLIGFTGRAYLNYLEPLKFQNYYIVWCGIDIDDYNDWQAIAKLIPEATIRNSKSNTGLHLFFRLEKPVLIEAGVPSKIIKESMKPFIKRLVDAGLSEYICKWDGNNFWLYNKSYSQKVLRVSKTFIKYIEPKEDLTRLKLHIMGIVEAKLNSEGQKFVDYLIKKELLPLDTRDNKGFYAIPSKMEVYIKKWFITLKRTNWSFKTKSPMKSTTNHGNGYIIFDGFCFKLFSNADNKFVKVLHIGRK